MTSAELYEIVKDDPEVWGKTIGYDQGLWYDRWGTVCAVSAKLAMVVLEGAYARATGCGVVLSPLDNQWAAFGVLENEDLIVRGRGPTRLSALIAAHRAQQETKR